MVKTVFTCTKRGKDHKKDEIIQIVHNRESDEPQVGWFAASEFKIDHWGMKLIRGEPNNYWSSSYDLFDKKKRDEMEIIGTRDDYPEYFL